MAFPMAIIPSLGRRTKARDVNSKFSMDTIGSQFGGCRYHTMNLEASLVGVVRPQYRQSPALIHG
jgi:hypothetical protein